MMARSRRFLIMSDTGSWGIEPLTDKNGDPIVGRPLRVGDYVLLSDGESLYEVELTSQATHGADTIGFHCQAINKEDQ